MSIPSSTYHSTSRRGEQQGWISFLFAKYDGHGNQSSTNVTQNVTITNEFHGDTAGQEKSATAMEKATDDMTCELARALNVT